LNGEPDLNPRGLTERRLAEYTVGDTLESMIGEDLGSEAYCGRLLSSDAELLEDLASLLQDVSSGAGHSARS
jgi:hypothetical protein